jgi:ribulose-phosphate 3-epimerase
VLASLRSADPVRLADEIVLLEAAGVDGLHLDLMDGHLVPDLCLGPAVVAAVRRVTRLQVDVHLLLDDPGRFFDAVARAGADRITVHVEAQHEVSRALERIRALGCRPGVACFPPTRIETLGRHLAEADLVNPLGVDPRAPAGGTAFQEATYQRLRWLAAERARLGAGCVLQGDGGVGEQTRDGLVEAGAQELVGGYPIFAAADRAGAIESLRRGYRA